MPGAPSISSYAPQAPREGRAMALAGGEIKSRGDLSPTGRTSPWNLWLPPRHVQTVYSTQEPKSTGEKGCPWGSYQPKEQLLDPLNRPLARP